MRFVPSSSSGRGSTVRKFGGSKLLGSGMSSRSRPSFFMRSCSGVVGGACSMPVMAQGIAARSTNSICRSKISGGSLSKPTMKPPMTQSPAERLEQALVELEKLRDPKKTAEEKRETRTSASDPEARVMKQAGGGFAPSYNAQISTDGKHGLIVAVDVTQAGNDCPMQRPPRRSKAHRTRAGGTQHEAE